MSNNELKIKVLEKIKGSQTIFHETSPFQYNMRCIFCGDSQKKLTDTHLYLKCSPDPMEPILFQCFKCNAHGKVDEKFLSLLGIDIPEFKSQEWQRYNKLPSLKTVDTEIITGSVNLESDQVGYIEYRIGPGLTYEDYDKFKIVWEIDSLLPYITTQRVKHTLPSNNDSISFLSDDKSMLLTRFFNPPPNSPEWKKSRLFPANKRSFYTIKATLNILSSETVYVNIAEGIFDILSIYKNFPTGENSLYLAFLGRDYEMAIEYIIARGLIGGNIIVRVYSDADIEKKFLRYRLRKFKWLFQSITLFFNTLEKDFGLNVERIKLVETKV